MFWDQSNCTDSLLTSPGQDNWVSVKVRSVRSCHRYIPTTPSTACPPVECHARSPVPRICTIASTLVRIGTLLSRSRYLPVSFSPSFSESMHTELLSHFTIVPELLRESMHTELLLHFTSLPQLGRQGRGVCRDQHGGYVKWLHRLCHHRKIFGTLFFIGGYFILIRNRHVLRVGLEVCNLWVR